MAQDADATAVAKELHEAAAAEEEARRVVPHPGWDRGVDVARAEARALRALEIRRRVQGPTHPDVGIPLALLAYARANRDAARVGDALGFLQRNSSDLRPPVWLLPSYSLLRRSIALRELGPPPLAAGTLDDIHRVGSVLERLGADRSAARFWALGARSDVGPAFAMRELSDAGAPRVFWPSQLWTLFFLGTGPPADGRGFPLPLARVALLAAAEKLQDRTKGSSRAVCRGLCAAARARDAASLTAAIRDIERELVELAGVQAPPDETAHARRLARGALETLLAQCVLASGDLDRATSLSHSATEALGDRGDVGWLGSTRHQALMTVIAQDGAAIRAVAALAQLEPNTSGALSTRDRTIEKLCFHPDAWRVPAFGLAAREAERGLAIRREMFGSGSAEEADGLASLGLVYGAAGHWEASVAAWSECVRIREAVLGENSPATHHAIAALSVVLASQGSLDAAQEALAQDRIPLGGPDVSEASIVAHFRRRVNLATIALARRDLDRAGAELEAAVRLLGSDYSSAIEKTGPAELDRMMDVVVGACRQLGCVAEELRVRQTDVWRRRTVSATRSQPDVVASSVDALDGTFDLAVAKERQALAKARKRAGVDAPLLDRRTDLGVALLRVGRVDEAFAWLKDAAARIEAGQIGMDDARRRVLDVLITDHTYLAQALLQRGAVDAALPYTESALRAYVAYDDLAQDPAPPILSGPLERRDVEAVLRYVQPSVPPDVPAVETYADALAAGVDPAEALQVLGDARHLLEVSIPADHPRLGRLLQTLARTRLAAGDVTGALADAERAAAVTERAFGPEHPSLAPALVTLADAQLAGGRTADALRAYERVLALADASIPDVHVVVLHALTGSARCLLRDGRAGEAVERMRRAVAAVDVRVRAAFAGSSSAERLQLLSSVHWVLTSWVEACAAARIDGYAEVLRLKGLAGRALQRDEQLLRTLQAIDPAECERLRAAERRLARLVYAAPGLGWRRVPWRREVSEAAAEVDRLGSALEARLSSRSEGLSLVDVGVDALRERLGPDESLVDVLLTGDRYVAWVVRPDVATARVDLGPAEDVATACARFREAIQAAPTPDAPELREAHRSLRTRLVEPLLAALPPSLRTLYVVPDGALAAIPLAAATAPDGPPPAVAPIRFIHLVAAQDLAQPSRTPRTSRRAVVVGGIDYDSVYRPGPAVTTGDGPLAARVPGTPRFAPLPATQAEVKGVADRITRAWRDGQVVRLVGDRAPESALRASAVGARLLHFATHGFVRDSLAGGLRTPAAEEYRLGPGLERHACGLDPLLATGLALSGANVRTTEDDDDGILTALEASGLDVADAELVFLAACDTARGVTQAGDGVTGLTRAFRSAGARQVVSTLWPVSDEATTALVFAFYERYLGADGGDASKALAAALADLAKIPRFVAPRHAAAFVVYGRP